MMEVFVKTLPGQTISVSVQQDIFVDSLYKTYAAEVARPEDSISFIFAGQQLERSNSCQAYGVKSMSVLHDKMQLILMQL